MSLTKEGLEVPFTDIYHVYKNIMKPIALFQTVDLRQFSLSDIAFELV